MGKDGGEVGHGGQDGEDADEGIECRLRADEDATEDGRYAADAELRGEGVSEGWRDVADDFAERHGVVAGECPKHAACGYVGAGDGDDDVNKEDDEKTGGARDGAAGCLEIDSSKGEFGNRRADDVGEGRNSV